MSICSLCDLRLPTVWRELFLRVLNNTDSINRPIILPLPVSDLALPSASARLKIIPEWCTYCATATRCCWTKLTQWNCSNGLDVVRWKERIKKESFELTADSPLYPEIPPVHATLSNILISCWPGYHSACICLHEHVVQQKIFPKMIWQYPPLAWPTVCHHRQESLKRDDLLTGNSEKKPAFRCGMSPLTRWAAVRWIFKLPATAQSKFYDVQLYVSLWPNRCDPAIVSAPSPLPRLYVCVCVYTVYTTEIRICRGNLTDSNALRILPVISFTAEFSQWKAGPATGLSVFRGLSN